MYWLAGLPGPDGQTRLSQPVNACQQVALFRHYRNANTPGEWLPPDGQDPSPARLSGSLAYAAELDQMTELSNLDGQDLNAEFSKEFGPACSQIITRVTSQPNIPNPSDPTNPIRTTPSLTRSRSIA